MKREPALDIKVLKSNLVQSQRNLKFFGPGGGFLEGACVVDKKKLVKRMPVEKGEKKKKR